MFAFAFVIYLQRTSFSVTAVQMMPELGITQVELGWLFTAYLIVYTAFQLPGGIFGEWLGARKALVVTGLVGFCAAMATPLVPLLLTGSAMLFALLVARIVLGLAHAPLFPVSTGVFETWFPVGHWGLPNGLQTSGLQFGSAAATPLIAVLMQTYGWKNALLWTSAAGPGAGGAVELVRPQQPGRAPARLRRRARGARGERDRTPRRRHQPARPAAGAGQPGHPAAGHLVHDHELRVLPAQHLVFPVPGAGAAPVGAGERLAGEPAVYRRRVGAGIGGKVSDRAGRTLRTAHRLPCRAGGDAAAGRLAAVRRRGIERIPISPSAPCRWPSLRSKSPRPRTRPRPPRWRASTR